MSGPFKSAKFWISMVLFQLVFGLAVFAVTRQYYLHEIDRPGARPKATAHPQLGWPAGPGGTATGEFPLTFPGEAAVQDPALMALQADDLFAKGRYGEAADLYEQLLLTDPNNVNTYNNLGITLQYLGRTEEALSILAEGVEVDSEYQRIWLTLGYVNKQAGSIEQARTALTKAVELGADSDVGRSAAEMLEGLP